MRYLAPTLLICAACAPLDASAQPVTNIYSILMCPIPGTTDAQGNPIVGVCGNTNYPVTVQVAPQVPAHGVFACKANPLTGKQPPLC